MNEGIDDDNTADDNRHGRREEHRSRSSQLFFTSWCWCCFSEGKEKRSCLDIREVGAKNPKLGEGSQPWVLPFFQI